MKPACRTCDHGFLNLDAKGARQPLEIRCEIDGSARAINDTCPRFAHDGAQQPSIGESTENG